MVTENRVFDVYLTYVYLCIIRVRYRVAQMYLKYAWLCACPGNNACNLIYWGRKLPLCGAGFPYDRYIS